MFLEFFCFEENKSRETKIREFSMKKKIMMIGFVVSLSLVFSSSVVLAKDMGKGRGSDDPSGWSKGEKKGWQGDAPPGLSEERQGEKEGEKEKRKTESEMEKEKREAEKERKRQEKEWEKEKQKTEKEREREKREALEREKERQKAEIEKAKEEQEKEKAQWERDRNRKK